MTILHDMLSSPLLHRVGWMLLHSLWQFSLIAIALAILLETLQRRSAATRYIVCCVALATTLLTAGITFSLTTGMPVGDILTVAPPASPIDVTPNEPLEEAFPNATADIAPSLPPSFPPIEVAPAIALSPDPIPDETKPHSTNIPEETTADTPPFADRISTTLQPWLPGASLVWFCGVLLLSLWNTGGWLGVVRLRRIGTEPVAQELRERVEAVANQLKLRQSVHVLQSAFVEVPVITGWWRPVLLMPVGIVTGLTSQQLDALLAHELTHVRRHDYLVNLIQTLVETVLFYHPAIWWMSRKIRAEREYCCDDAAIRVCGDGVEYATVLAAFEQMRAAPRPAVAATDGNTLSRVRRILGDTTPTRRLTKSLAGSLAFVMVVVCSIACFIQTNVESTVAAESPTPGTAPAPGDFGTIQWKHTDIRKEAKLTLAADGSFQLLQTRHVAIGLDPQFKEKQAAVDTPLDEQDNAEPADPSANLPPEAFIFRDVKTTRAGKWRLLHPKLQLFALDEEGDTRGVRLYQVPGEKTRWRFEPVLLTDNVSQHARHNWLRATPEHLAELSALAPFPGEKPLTNLPKSKTKYTKLNQDVPQQTVARLTRIVPEDWSLFVAGNSVLLTHDHPIEVEYIYPSATETTVAESWNDMAEERINIQLQFFPRIKPEKRLAQVKQLQDQIDALAKQMAPFKDPPRRKPSLLGYHPTNDEQRKLLDQYAQATRTRNALPDYYDAHSSVELAPSLSGHSYLTNQQVDKQLDDLVNTVKGLFHTYSATDDHGVLSAQQAIIIAAIQTPAPQSGVGEAEIGIDPSNHLAKRTVIDGLSINVAPGKPQFKPTDRVFVDVTVTNRADTPRYLGISPNTGKHDDGQDSTTVDINGQRRKIGGIPGYAHVRGDVGWNVRLGSNGYSDRYEGAVEIKPGSRATFQVILPAFGDNMNRPTGRLTISSRFAVARKSDGPRVYRNGRKSFVLIVDQEKLAQGVATLKEALAGKAKKTHEIENAIHAIADNPAPEHVELVAKVVGHPWPSREHIQWNLWYAASKYVDPAIYKMAVAEANNPKLGVGIASLVYKTIYRNRQHLKRSDALQIVRNPLLQSADFAGTNSNGFWPTILLATVAQQEDIPLLGELCGKFIPPRIGHDLSHASMPNLGLQPIHAAFMRHPDASRVALRKVLGQGRVPGEFKPWAHEFGIGLVPKSLVLIAKWSAELKDTEAIPLLEHYAKTDLVRVTNSMQSEAPKLIAAIDGPAAIKALRRIGPRGTRERAKLGDPVAIDALIAQARALFASRDDDTGEAHSTFALVFSIMNPNHKVTYRDVRDGMPVELQWKQRRAAFAKVFATKYGFDPEITEVQLSLRADAESWNAGDTPTFKIDIHNNGPKTWTLPPSQPLYEIEVDGTWYQWIGPISVLSPLVKPGKGLTDIPLKADGKFFQHIQQAPGDTKLIPLKFPLGRHTIRVACSPDPEDATKTERVRVVSNRVNIEVVLSEKHILSAVKKQLTLESAPTVVKKAKRPELRLPFLRKKYGDTEIWEVAVGIKPPLKLDPPIKGIHAFVGPRREILKLQTTPASRRPLKPETTELALTAQGYTLCALPAKYQIPLKELLHQRQDHSFWAGDRKGKQQMEVFFATREGKKGIICLFLLRGYQHMITPPPMIVDGKAKESPISIIDIAWMIDYDLDTKQWGGRGSFPDGED